MVTDRKEKKWGSIPVHFFDEEGETEANDREEASEKPGAGFGQVDSLEEISLSESNLSGKSGEPGEHRSPGAGDVASGPMLAELLATRAELKRVEGELAELKRAESEPAEFKGVEGELAELKRVEGELAEVQDRLTRRQADFENYRKRTERERAETYNRVVADVVSKLLPVIDNLRRAVEAERSLEASESEEFRHFLHGVELINKQLNEVLESLGLEAVPAMGERFDPHVHEAVVIEPTDKYEPETVIQEIVRGYRIGERLLRPAMVKVATEPSPSDG